MNFPNFTLSISLSFDNISVSYESSNGNITNSFSLKLNLSELRIGVNFSDTTISDSGTARVSYTDVSLSIEFLIALAFLLNGVPVSNATPKPYVPKPIWILRSKLCYFQ